MPAPMLNALARMMCDHGGQVMIIPRQEVVLAGEAPALAEGDLVGSPIVGCGLPVTPLTVPCTAVVSEIPMPGIGMSLVAMIGGRPALLEGVQCITDSVPPATAMVIFPGQTQVLA